MRVIRGGFECTMSPESVATMVRGISYLREIRDYDGMPVVLRVRLSEKGMHIEARGVRGGREELYRAQEWERGNGNGGGEFRGELVESLLSLPVGRGKGSKRGPQR
jgi:hypothetical protein